MNVIIGIDFGTARSGWAWNIKNGDRREDIQDDLRTIEVNTLWADIPPGYPKTPTVLFLDTAGDWFFGGTALKKHNNKEEGIFFDRIKMDLYHPDSNRKRGIELHDDGDMGPYRVYNGKRYNTVDLIAKFLEFLKNDVVEREIKSRNQYLTTLDIQWILTVPAGATDDQKAIMRESARRAGLISREEAAQEKLLFVFEPNAAAIACAFDDKLDDIDKILKNKNVVVFDAGGGTIDISAIKYSDNKGIHTFTGVETECAFAGSTYLDIEFEKFLDDLFGKEKMASFRIERLSEYNAIMDEWVKEKESYTVTTDKDSALSIRIADIRDYFIEKNWDFSQIQENNRNIIQLGGRKLSLKEEEYEKISLPVWETAIEPLEKILLDMRQYGHDIDLLIFAGGFSSSYHLREFVKSKFQVIYNRLFNKSLNNKFFELNSHRMSQAILAGSVVYGNDPDNLMPERVLKMCYGIECYAEWKGIDNYFSVIAERGRKFLIRDKVTEDYRPHHPEQTSVSIKVFCTPRTDAITTNGLSLMREIEIKSPDTRKGKDRKIFVTFEFGKSEIYVTVLDEESGNTERFPIDCKWTKNREILID